MNRTLFTCIRTYATKSKTTNLKMKASVPLEQTPLADGSLFIARQPIVAPNVQAQVAPALHKSKAVTKKLSEAEITEMRQLRESDPSTWTRSKLAKKFGCSELFVGIAAPSTTKQPVEQVVQHGYRRKLITEQRQKRRALW